LNSSRPTPYRQPGLYCLPAGGGAGPLNASALNTHILNKWRNLVADQNIPLDDDALAAAAAAADALSDDNLDPVLLKAELEQAQQQLAEVKDQALRVAAEAQNQRRRADKDVENAHKFALEKFAAALLTVADNLERTLEAADRTDAAAKPLLEGVELTHKDFLEVLAKFSVVQIDPLGAPFDPQFHQAVSMVDNPSAEPNSVLHVMQKGYTLNGRLLRAAMVMVAKGQAKTIDANA
jgi:molecular chaperone GrpE